jgi:benzoyl-CoA reductase subunit C
MKDTQAIFDHFQYIVDNTKDYAKSLQDKGSLIAGYMCNHVPEEVLYAAGFVPIRVLSSHESQAMTRSIIHETYCSFSHDCAYRGFKDYAFFNLIVTASSCIHMGEAYNAWARFAGFETKSFLITYPHIIHTKQAGSIIKQSFKQFITFLEGIIKRPITDEEIEKAIKTYNKTRRLLQQLWGLLKDKNSPITGTEAATITLAAQVMDKQEFNTLIEDLLAKLKGAPSKLNPGVRLLISGGACDDAKIFSLMEGMERGANVIFSDTCTGIRYCWFEVAEDSPDKLQAIIDAHIERIPCPAKDNYPGTGEKKRIRFFRQFLDDYKPDGVVLLYQRFCSPQPMDVVDLKPILDKLGIPWLDLELDTTIPKVQFQTQLETLISIITGVAS